MSQKVLVTGGAGFIGSQLCKQLLSANYEVFCLDNFYTGRRENVNGLCEHPNFSLLEQDVIEPILLDVDLIFNLACPASPIHYQSDPIKTIKTSVIGAINVLDLAKRLKAKVLQASTSEVYGDPEVHPQPEGYWGNVNPIGVRSCYDEGKRCAESLFFDYRRQHDLNIKVARIFNTYGPRMTIDDGRVVSNFIVQALKGKPLTVFGAGTQTRSFCYVDDLVEGIMKLMNSYSGVVGPINLGNPEEITMIELAQLVLEITNSNSNIVFVTSPQDDPKRRQPQIDLARDILNWKPKTCLADGLKATIADFAFRLENS